MPLPRSVTRFNRTILNRVLSPAAARLPAFGIVIHRGRKSGRSYRTPVNIFRQRDGYVIALTYGVGDWVRNVSDFLYLHHGATRATDMRRKLLTSALLRVPNEAGGDTEP